MITPGRATDDDRGERPVIVFFNDFFGEPVDTQALGCDNCLFTTDRTRLADASAVVFHVPGMRSIGPARKRPGQLWLAWSMESEVNFPLLADPAFMRNFDLTMTYRRSSDIWCPYFPSETDFDRALSAPIPPKTASAPAAMFQSSAFNRSGRDAFARELMTHMRVDSYGKFLNNRRLTTADRGRETKLATIASYKFCLAFENSVAVDYVTEKFFDPLLGGSVPVYLGAPNVDMFAPGEGAFIDATTFGGPRELAEFLTHLDNDDEAYRQYFRWRETGLSQGFRQLLSTSKAPFSRLCEIVLAGHKRLSRRPQRTQVAIEAGDRGSTG